MDLKSIKAIYRFIKSTDIVEIEVEGEGGKVRLRRGTPGLGAQTDELGTYEGSGAAPVAAPAAAAPAPVETADNIEIIASPMVGTFYRASSPDAASFVEIGSVVRSGHPLCIIEAMKLMNEVESEYNGKIVSILVENGQPVEYGEPLFHVEVSK
ncbi:MAG: acetyl-CoA carboxylase biotin carboxyl carrier protein [Proteobacteria bacterium]|nr:acetyl-CoA carboxylase biotin carboxyl carrier protein [Pseudomonadota bacterium]